MGRDTWVARVRVSGNTTKYVEQTRSLSYHCEEIAGPTGTSSVAGEKPRPDYYYMEILHKAEKKKLELPLKQKQKKSGNSPLGSMPLIMFGGKYWKG